MTQSTPSESNDAPVVIFSAQHEAEAGIVINALANAGIMAKAHGEFSAGFRAEAPGEIKIMIHQSDLEAAKAVLEDIRSDEEIDWDNIDVGDPESP